MWEAAETIYKPYQLLPPRRRSKRVRQFQQDKLRRDKLGVVSPQLIHLLPGRLVEGISGI
jgi:hypothetical protein